MVLFWVFREYGALWSFIPCFSSFIRLFMTFLTYRVVLQSFEVHQSLDWCVVAATELWSYAMAAPEISSLTSWCFWIFVCFPRVASPWGLLIKCVRHYHFFFLQNSMNLSQRSLRLPNPNLPRIPITSPWLTFAFRSSIMMSTSCFAIGLMTLYKCISSSSLWTVGVCTCIMFNGTLFEMILNKMMRSEYETTLDTDCMGGEMVLLFPV